MTVIKSQTQTLLIHHIYSHGNKYLIKYVTMPLFSQVTKIMQNISGRISA
jgi:hypothetical protein